MSFWEFRRGVASVRLLLDFGAELGVDAATLLKGTHIAPELLDKADGEILASQELRAIENLLRRLRHPPGLGLRFGQCYRLATFGLWGYGLMSSASFGAAIEMALRFVPLTFAYTTIGFHRAGDEALLNFVEADFEPALSRFLVERDMAAATGILCQLAGEDFRLRRFELKRMPGRRLAGEAGGVAIDSEAAFNRLGFDARELARRPPHANPGTVALCEQMCAQLMEQRRARLGTAKLLEHYLGAHSTAELPSLSRFARLLDLSERTLKRRLQEEGTSFRELVMAARSRQAGELVGDSALSIGDIAERLGYADLSSFSQAFKRWYGISPAAYRRAPP